MWSVMVSSLTDTITQVEAAAAAHLLGLGSLVGESPAGRSQRNGGEIIGAMLHHCCFLLFCTCCLLGLTWFCQQSNEVNQGDALEHNFSAVHAALLFPVTHLLRGAALPQVCSPPLRVASAPSGSHGCCLTPVFCSGGPEVDAVHVVQAVQGVRPLLGAGGHG